MLGEGPVAARHCVQRLADAAHSELDVKTGDAAYTCDNFTPLRVVHGRHKLVAFDISSKAQVRLTLTPSDRSVPIAPAGGQSHTRTPLLFDAVAQGSGRPGFSFWLPFSSVQDAHVRAHPPAGVAPAEQVVQLAA